LRQQLAAINAKLQPLNPGNTDLRGTGNGQEDEDELELLIRRVDTLPAGSEVRCVASSEARRLNRISPQNAGHGIVRNYVRRSIFLNHIYPDVLLQLEWLTSLPRVPTNAIAETLMRSDFLAIGSSGTREGQ
jgi:hypothetical protein